MEKKQPKLSLKTRFFGIQPIRVKNEWLYELITLEQDDDGNLEIIDRKGPYYMVELNTFLKVALGREKDRIFKGVINVD